MNKKYGIISAVIGVIGILISSPTFISEVQHNTRWHGGIINALGMLCDENFWVIPTIIISIILLVVGLRNIFDKGN